MEIGTMKWRLVAFAPGKRTLKMTEALFTREYMAEPTALRAAGQVHRRFPDANIELWPFTWKGVFWSGDSSDNEPLYWCPGCGKRLDDWSAGDGTTRCRHCGDEWHEETLKAS